MSDLTKYETVIGLEVHAQLLTQSKLFCGDSTAFVHDANTNISPITLGHPGTLPRLNKEAVTLALRLGIACGCEIERQNLFARKNYFYPDLPKGYQISQHTHPVCKGGHVPIATANSSKAVRLNRIHIEEDAGKSIHDIDPDHTLVDYNRAGMPLVEIVTEPDLSSSDEAWNFLTELRKLVRYLDVCDGNMEEGSLRCDANISIRPAGQKELGTRVEVKNLNSIRHVKKAIDHEVQRMTAMLEKGETIRQETRSYDAGNDTTFAIRSKEEADDYRYFPEPDLSPFFISDDFISEIKSKLPRLQNERIAWYTSQFALPEYDARVLTEDKATAGYFERITEHTIHYKAAANWLLGPVKSWLNEQAQPIEAFPLQPAAIAELIALVEAGTVSFSAASGRLFTALLQQPSKQPEALARELNLVQERDGDALAPLIDAVLLKYPDKVTEYRKGKKGLMGLFVGEVMKASKGKADPKLTNDLLLEKLK
jgi:aspartyl-tRNA(Asn)/glutamyl-tRNA(Gln) amidotransferase subunit B